MVYKRWLPLLAVLALLASAAAQVQFTSSRYTADLNEEEPLGTEVVTVGAFYFDPPRLFTDGEFSLPTAGDAAFFTLETVQSLPTETSGIVRTAVVFDRDVNNAQTMFEFDVIYTTPDGSQSGTAQVRVSLVDINDNAPRFTERVFNVPVAEGTLGGTAVFNVTAEDPDRSLSFRTINETTETFGELQYTVDNGRIIYRLIAGNELGHFSINPDNGTLSLSSDAVLDVDLIELYNLTALAIDGGDLNDTATVLVHILDSNDNPPEILSPLAVEVTIPEDTLAGYVIVESINATDADRGLNAEIRFLITDGDVTNSFEIDEVSGEIIVSAPLDREVSATLDLTVAARDQGIVPLQDTIIVVVNLLDINDYAPTFLQESYEATVSESSDPNTSVTRIEAMDLDLGPNGTVTYSILSETNGTFVIIPQTGEIFTNRTLDREEIDSYSFEVEAVDNPENLTYQLSSVVGVTILIGDVNDNPPIFEQDSYEVNILDTARRNTEIIQLVANDLDVGLFGEVSYHIVSFDSTDPDAFRIHETTGVVSVNQVLRYEDQETYFYMIRALDNQLSNDVQLTINVHNMNENPPVFEEEVYNVSIFETTRVGRVVLNVTASDPDEGLGPIGEVSYRIITQFDDAGSFAVNETTGEVFVNSTLDFDFRGEIFFQIEAYDGAFFNSLTDVTNVTIILLGENDEAPTIEFPEGFQILVLEHEPPEIDLVVLLMYTTDPDFGSGGEFMFAIVNIYDSLFENDSFTINETTGLITTLRAFDRELQPEGIVVAIETTDFGDDPQSQVTNITIMIADINDNPPIFESDAFAMVYEFLPPGVEVLSEYRAIDRDTGSNTQLEYEIFAGNENGSFSIDPQTGGIFTAQELNKTVQDFYNLSIIAGDQGNPQMFGFGQITIEVIDANDNVPTFSESLYEITLLENSTIGTTILQVNASDSDVGTNAVIQYFLAPNSSHSERFAVNSSTGEIYTTDEFDRESDAFLELIVVAIDDGEVPLTLTGSVTVLITIGDLNDNPPQFNETSYEASVVENELSGTLIISVLANDTDAEEPNNVIRYSLSGNRSEAFRVDPVSGDVFVNGEVDWEEGANFTLVVIATDLGDPPQSAEAEISLFIEDVNDNSPTFVAETLNLSIPENSEVGRIVGCVKTDDRDSNGNNSLHSYSIIMDFADGRFDLDEESGLVTFVSGTLDREVRPSFDLFIQATDHGSPQRSADATLIITILDANDFDPVFDQDLYYSSVFENSPTGTSILTVRATDDHDIGANADLKYSILNPFFLQYFNINASTGVISVGGNTVFFDFENITFVTFEVQVTDSRSDPRNDTTTVEIEIADSNDHPPDFEQDEYSAVLRENLASGTTVLRVNASDVDTGNNSVIEYSIKPGLGSSDFGIHPETGVLYTARYLNREEFLYYNLTIIANNSDAPIPLFSEVQAIVNLTDLNDMHPSFDPVITKVSVPENTPVNLTLFSLLPADGDEDENGTVTYSLQLGNEDGVFGLDSLTGDITLLQELDFESRSLYVFTVMANDSGTPSLGNYTNVLVQVTDSNDNDPSFASPGGYAISVSGNAPEGTVIATVVAFDRDQGLNAELTYAITADDSPGLFSLESSAAGRLRTESSLFGYDDQIFNLTIQASDAIRNTTTPVTVFIQRGDVNLPRFTEQSFSVPIPEDTAGGQSIFEFSSFTENEVRDSYNIVNGNVDGIFNVTGTGIVKLELPVLDFETQSLYQLSISIANSAGDVAYTILDVVVTDVNEYAPVFISDSFFAVVSEILPARVPFFTVNATDRDSSSPANDITYDITPGDLVLIDSQTGELSLSREVDYQAGDQSFNLTVIAANEATSPQLSTNTSIEIMVLKGNKFQPVFSPVTYDIALSEDIAVGLNVVNVSASDEDIGSQGEITYGMHGDHRYLDFRIDTFNGSIFTNYPLDRERQTLYTLDIIASDGGNPNRFATAAVSIRILDLNDNTPVWDQTQYFTSLIENITVGSTVISVGAMDLDQVDQFTDPDTGETTFSSRNGYVTYSITDGNPENQFGIDEDTGVVTIVSTLDREVFPEYNLTLNATDGPGLFANAYLHIVVHDANDQIPEFSESPYQVGIPEDAENGTFVVQVAAVDTDLNQNSNFTFVLSGGNNGSTFTLNSTSGEIFLETSLNREAIDSFTLVVEARDMGTVPLTGTVDVQITVLDINEFPPVFSAENYTGEVFENEPLGTPILQVSASDMDFEENGTVQFVIIPGNETERFNINSSSGEISVAGSLDFEQQETYDFIVMAIDSAPASERLSSEVNVTVVIVDRNDNRPVFSPDSYSAIVSESAFPGTEVISVEVTDADSGSNSQIVFSIDFLGDSEAEANFVIEPQSGMINLTTNVDLDRERTQSYDVIVIAMDQGDPPRQATVPVTIAIADSNDNMPQFTQPFFEGALFENLPAGTPAAVVSATDADIDENAALEFEITAVIDNEEDCNLTCNGAEFCQSVFDQANYATQPNFPFYISTSNLTGEIFSSQTLDRENISNYILLVQANDSPLNETQLSSTACVHVSILDRNDETPIFNQTLYEASISEFTGDSNFVVQVFASDADISTNAEITFQLLSETGSFTVHPERGEIFTVGEYDRETREVYNITIAASDGLLEGTAFVVVTILDENDNRPEFSNSLFFASIEENMLPNSPVIQLNATDADISVNAEITYTVESSTPENHFGINPTTGQLYTLQLLDRENISEYLVTILATDSGVPALSTSVQVNVSVQDTNDLAPVFVGTPYLVQVEENSLQSGAIFTVQADDGDVLTNAEIFFTLAGVEPEITGAFEINETSGELFLMQSLNAEASLIYSLTVVADNGPALPEQVTEVTVTVIVLDQNDNQPQFRQEDYVTTISEDMGNGSVVIQLEAFDLDATDTNSRLMFEITGGFNTSLFTIDAISGIITVEGLLDRESEPTHILEVTVFDSGSPAMSSTATVTIILQDFNDNVPVFEQSAYTFTVVENQPEMTSIGQVRANDLDLQVISYYFQENVTDGSSFSINLTTGELFSAAVFDREAQEVYSFIIVATDNGIAIERTAAVLANVTVLDQNDVPPAFFLPLYNVSWLENTTTGTVLLTVEAFDPDLGENGTVEYSITQSNDSSFFSINTTSGEIFLEQMLNREEQDFFQFKVSVFDFGSPRLTGSATIELQVLDNNDNIPVLNASEYQATLNEDTPVGSTVAYIGASDEDIDENAAIRFSLSDDFDGTFSIGSESGIVVLTRSLDYELIQSYNFSVIARDSAQEPLSSSSSFLIEIVDLNDNPPLFDSTLYQVSVPENAILNTPVFLIPATDADSTSNGELRYTILSGNFEFKFAVNEVAGVISVADYLNREITSSYSLSLQVVDLGSPQFTANTELEITIADVNDHPPEFGSKTYSIFIPELIEIGTAFFTFEPNDFDIDQNANFSYAIVSGNSEAAFDIDPFLGRVIVSRNLDFETTPAYSLSVSVTDNGYPIPLSDIANLRVLLTDQNEHPPLFIQNEYIANVSQNAVIGAPIGFFIATDADVYSQTQITYSLINITNDVLFSLDPLSGTLYVRSELYPTNVTLTFEATDGVYTIQTDIHITIIEEPSDIPQFVSAAYLLQVSEATDVNTLIGQLDTTLSPATISSASSAAIDEIFQVTSSGKLILIGQLDRETVPAYVFNVQSQSETGEITFAIVTVQVMDHNDITPVFESTLYSVSVSELVPVGTTILTLRAFDRDPPGENSDVEITVAQGNEDGMFALEPLSGALTILQTLDSETQSTFTLIANVTNNLASPKLFSTAEIIITILDVNDNNPEFSQMFYQIQIPETIALGSDILILEASDSDSGTNSELVFSITNLNIPYSFTINQTSGAISTNSTFDVGDTATSYVISAMVADRGNPQPRSDVTTIFVEVTPSNDFGPEFSQPDGFSTEIPDTLPIGGSVLQISATDPDGTVPLSLSYSIQAGDPRGIFEIDPLTGLISLASDIDFQEQSFYELAVEAVDFGTPSRSSLVTVNISIIDINNNDPEFDQARYEVAVFENITIGTLILQVFASDPDATSLTYSLTVNAYQNGNQLFVLDNSTGELSTTASIDRELDDSLELLVTAIDSGYPIQRSRSVPVVVSILDLNDNPPLFDQPVITIPVLRLLPPGRFVATVTATDADLVGQQLSYTITEDNSGSLFYINSTSGEITTTSRVPEFTLPDVLIATPDAYELTLTAFDGIFTTEGMLRMELAAQGEFCEDGFCTRIRPVNCTFDIFPFIECNPFCVGDYALSPERRICLQFYCLDSTLVPCTTTRTCVLPNEACAGVCPEAMSVCPTTNLCHFVTLSESCDGSDETCLIGQTLVQRADNTRYCVSSAVLPANGLTCVGEGEVYCEALDECSNLTASLLCQACPTGLQVCGDTRECVPDLVQCCGFSAYYCDILGRCLTLGERCELPNVAPVIQSSLIYLESILSFNPSDVLSSSGHVIGLLLSDNSSPAVDLQGEELGIAIVEVSSIPQLIGEWQYALCTDVLADTYGACSNITSVWLPITDISETNALILTNSARIRFVRRAVELSGAVWVRAKLWDGNQNGFLSPSADIVRFSDPHYNSTLPFTTNGAYSESTTLITILVHPLIEPPRFSDRASFQFSSIEEDVVFVQIRGNTVIDLVTSIDTPSFTILPEDTIEGFPSTMFEQLLEPSVRESYYAQVQRVNPTRRQRIAARDSGQDLGVGVSFNADEDTGRWQVTLDGDPRTFVYLDSVVSTNDQVLLLNTSARLRFLPADDFCGSAKMSLFVQPWDGFWDESLATMLDNGYIVTPGSEENASLSQYNLNEPQTVEIDIVCIPDKPIAIVNQVQLDPIPYQITHRYERLFTVLVDRELSSLRAEEERFSDLLQLTLRNEVDLRRFYPANANSTYVSFTVRDDPLSFSEAQQLIVEREESLAELGYEITTISQDASYGVGSGCFSEGPTYHHGTQVNSLVARFATDDDGDYLGIAVVGVTSSLQHGVWQYHRGDWNRTETAFNANSSVWINFPVNTSDTSAFLLHGSDRIRFLPRPSFYWQNSSSEATIPPAIQVKIWDNSFRSFDATPMSEVSLANINTNPFVDTLQSLTNPVGLFSDAVVAVEASRYGCDGIVDSGLVYDACCVCGGNGSPCMGCDSQIDSNAVYDACDICGGDDTACLGCDFIPFSGVEPGPCEECISDVLITGEGTIEILYPLSSFVDCNGVCYGTSLLDDCSVCSGGETLHGYNSDIDCAGMCFGNATIDDCGDCTGPGTGLYFNQNLDCTGVCDGPFAADSCGICQLPGEGGVVVENRDCAGVCFGDARLDMCGVCYDGSTNVSANSTVDVCGVCNGDSTSCFGCDDVVNSGRTVDRCGTCDGNNCGCFKIDFITPERGPRTGGTEITIYGAGFFLNDSSIPGYSFEPESDNCGAPLRFPSGESISIACRFLTANSEQQLRGFSTPMDQSSIRCITESTVDFPTYIPEFFIQLQVEDGPLSNLVTFYYDDYSVIDLSDIVPQDAEILGEATVSFLGENFVNASAAACLIYDLAACGNTFSSTENPLAVPATYHNSSAMSCTMPSVDVPCRVTTRLSLDGQESGILQSSATDFLFVYRFSAPEVQSIHFSDDLSSLIIQFDRQAELSSGPSLMCENIFTDETYVLLGGQGANCYWTNDVQEEITISLPRNATVRVGSPITFRSGTVLTRGQLYSYAVSTLTVYYVDSELNAIPPVAILNGPSSIPLCGMADFTAIYSLNPGYSSLEYQWSVFVVNISIPGFSDILRYLNSLSATSASISLDSNLFLPGVEYYLELHVVNSIGVWSEPVTVLLFKDTTPLLQLTIIGSSEREILSGEDLSVESLVTTLECSESIGVLEFNWQLFRITDARQLLLTEEDLSSIPTESSDIFIPAEYFAQNTSYILQLSVSAGGLNAASVNTTVTVLPLSIQAVVHGGNRTVSQSRVMVLDARSSTLNPILPEATYVWSCNVVGSFEPCYNQSELLPTPIVIPQSNFIAISASSLEAERSYNITLTLTQEAQVSHAFTVIQIINSISPPLVEILPITGNILSSRQIRLEGLVYSALPTTAVTWEALRLPGQGYIDLSNLSTVQSQITYPESQDLLSVSSLEDYTSIPLEAFVTQGETSRANLVLQPNTLIAGLTYTFQLTAMNNEGSGFAQVSIIADRSPHSAILSVAPQTGVALETQFLLTVSGVIDTAIDTPVLYQYGIVQEPDLDPTMITDENICWISGIQTESSLQTILPSGEGENSFVLVRVFDRKGGHSDIVGQVTITSNQIVNETFYETLLDDIRSTLESTKDWSIALSRLTATLLELNKNTTVMSQGIRAEALGIFLNVFRTQLPASQTHYDLAASVLALITSNREITDPGDQIRITEALETVLNWYRRNSVSVTDNPTQVSNQFSGEPLLLFASNRTFTRNTLTQTTSEILLSSWVNVLASPTSTPAVAQSFVQNVESISYILCQEMVLGEAADLIESSLANVYVRKTVPSGAFNVSGIILDFRSSLLESYQSQFCQNENTACSEMCFQGAHYPFDLFADRNMQIATLNNESQMALLAGIEGSDPQGIEIFSSVVSTVISSPSQNRFLEVSNLETSFRVLIPMQRPIPSDGSQALCLSRAIGGTSGFENFEWQIDNINSPQISTIDSLEYFVCEFTHLSEFAVGLLPPPIVTEPPIMTTSTVTSVPESSSSSSTTSRTIATETTPPPTTPTETPAGGISSAIIFIAIIFIVIAIGVVIILLVICLAWRSNRKKKMKVRPGDSTGRPPAREAFAQEEREREKAKLTRAGLLTPEESKISMNIIQLLDSGERSQIGSMNILPSIRLRELRHELSDHFDSLKSKPFYFLTRQLCDIPPAAEQQQFVSLVYGDEPNKPVFVKEVAVVNEQSRRHFCICNNAAVFECSNCSSQGYCSEECQLKHWSEQHQRECSRMSERKRRSEILLRRQASGLTTLSPIEEIPRLLPISSPLGGQVALSPTTPTDWKSFLSSTKSSQPVSTESPARNPLPLSTAKSPQTQTASPRTTLAHLAQQPSIPAPSQGEITAVSPQKLVPSEGFQSSVKRKLPPLSRVPSKPLPATSTPSDSFSRPGFSYQSYGSYESPAQQTLAYSQQPSQAPLQPFFTHTGQARVPNYAGMRQLSIQSATSDDFNLSKPFSSRDVRNEPLLESDEDDYESTETESEMRTPTPNPNPLDAMRSPSVQTGSRPPSLAVRKKRGALSQTSRASSSSSSGSRSRSGSDSETSSSDSERTPLRRISKASRASQRSNSRPVTSDLQQRGVKTGEQPAHD